MRTIAHLSDLHFGAEDGQLVQPLAEDVAAAAPTVVAVSGDLTQRARPHEFSAARAWLDRLPAPSVVVPGNHDVPLYDLFRRTLHPLSRFRRYVHADPDPVWHDDRLLVLGVNTARSAVVSSGRVSTRQIDLVHGRLDALGEGRARVLVAHHPFAPSTAHGMVGRGKLALRRFAAAGLDLVLAGHHHLGFSGELSEWHVGLASSVLVSQAGTALSHRRRGDANEWTLIALDDRSRAAFTVRSWDGRRFRTTLETRFRRTRGRWERE